MIDGAPPECRYDRKPDNEYALEYALRCYKCGRTFGIMVIFTRDAQNEPRDDSQVKPWSQMGGKKVVSFGASSEIERVLNGAIVGIDQNMIERPTLDEGTRLPRFGVPRDVREHGGRVRKSAYQERTAIFTGYRFATWRSFIAYCPGCNRRQLVAPYAGLSSLLESESTEVTPGKSGPPPEG